MGEELFKKFYNKNMLKRKRWKSSFSTMDIKEFYEFDEKGDGKKGNYGEVLKVKHKILKKDFAVKIIKKNAENTTYVDNEINIMKDLDHPNIVKFIEIFVCKENIYIVMDYYKGKTMKELTKQ